MKYSIKDIATIINAKTDSSLVNYDIHELSIDSRDMNLSDKHLFIAIRTKKRDGHLFLKDAYKKGVRNFIISSSKYSDKNNSANYLFVSNTVKTLQEIAKHYRQKLSLPLLSISGSNGKTIVKEWLFELLKHCYANQKKIFRSPKSFNSQIGVPLSICLIDKTDDFAIIESGISESGEMKRLEEVIQPNEGIFTNLNSAHDSGFNSREEKFLEKIQLFTQSNLLIISNELLIKYRKKINETLKSKKMRIVSWGEGKNANLQIQEISSNKNITFINAQFNGEKKTISIPFLDDASIENAITCWTYLLSKGFDNTKISNGMNNLTPINMRLEYKKGVFDSTIINDSYSNDYVSLNVALKFLDLSLIHISSPRD